MIKRLIWGFVATLFFVFQFNVGNASAVELSVEDRTVALNDSGDTIVLSTEQYKQGQKVFTNSCSYCHNGGRTKTNPNVTLSGEDLALAEPSRDSITGIVNFLKNPASYDGEIDISDLHPNTKRLDLFSAMRNYTDDDLKAVAGYILVQPKVRGIGWGAGKVYN
jgi:photosystem II cytochrome c550